MQLDSRRQGSAKDYVVQELIHDIVNIKLKPGEKLCEPALCERFGVSRTPFREAELELAQRKLIVVRPKIGTFVSFIDKELVEEVRHLRSVLEAELAVMACSMLTKKILTGFGKMLRSGKCICSGAITRKFYSWINRFMPWCMRCAAELTGMNWWKVFHRILTERPC